MLLSNLLQPLLILPKEADRDVQRLVLDSRTIEPGDLFLAVKGTKLDGTRFIPDAVSKGAVAILVDSDEAPELSFVDHVPLIAIKNLTKKAAKIAAQFYQHPASDLQLYGVTGTNGKTSCTHFLAQVMQANQIPCGVIGTLGHGFINHLSDVGLTTPDPIRLQAYLKALKEQGAKAVAMEVSSHSIDQGRINDLGFEVGIFTNLTQDHLDYHGTMEAYAAVKQRFLLEWPLKYRVVNVDDAYGKKWLDTFPKDSKTFIFSCKKPTRKYDHFPTIYADKIKLTWQGLHATVHSPWGSGALDMPLLGRFNLSNALAVLTASCLHDLDFHEVLFQLSQIRSVPGRMEKLGDHGKPVVVVDYSHTPDALEKALMALKHHIKGRVTCVFGCGGDRDRAKRPLMAKVAEKYADNIIVTNDNPRFEEPLSIAQDILKGFSNKDRVKVELDRSKAILESIQCAGNQDCILIAGKGAEHYQQIGADYLPFDDVSVATTALNQYPSKDTGEF